MLLLIALQCENCIVHMHLSTLNITHICTLVHAHSYIQMGVGLVFTLTDL